MRQGKAKLHVLKPTSVFHHIPSVGPKQLCVLAHLGCTREAHSKEVYNTEVDGGMKT